jgi:hypothetical protein
MKSEAPPKGDGLASLVILMIESEQPEGLSARKLVVETAKHNVITAYTLDDGLNLLRRFPNVDAILVHGALLENNPTALDQVKGEADGKPIILACPFESMKCPQADYVIDSHQPQNLLLLLTEQITPRFQTR